MIYSTVICLIFFAALIMWLIRFSGKAGARYPDNKAIAFITKKHNFVPSDSAVTNREILYIFFAALIFRVAVFLLTWLAKGIFSIGSAVSFAEYCESWNIWDAPHYLEIAQYGYSHKIEDGNFYMLVFFPLYPLIIRLFAFLIRDYTISGLAVSMLSFSAGCVMTYKLVSIDYSKSIARTSVALLSVAPFAFYYGSIMTESLFFLLTISTFYAIRKHKWFAAGVLGMLTALTRSFGVFMIVVAAVEWAQANEPIELIRSSQWRTLGKRFASVLPILIIPVGTLIYLFINYKTAGDAFVFARYQSEHWSMNLQFFGKTARMLWDRTTEFKDTWSNISSLFIPELIALPVFTLIILYSVRRTRPMYSAFMFIYFAFNAAASWPLSLSRYLACMFPVYWVIAGFTDRHKQLEPLIISVSAIAFGIYLAGYITVHNIM